MSNIPETRYATVGTDRVAYQVLGAGSRDLVFTHGQMGHVDLDWEEPATARFLRRLASFSRLIRFDPRDSGQSDSRPQDGRPFWEHWAEELLAVLDAARSSSAAIVGYNAVGPLAIPFAAAHPERVSGLVLINTSARYTSAPDYPEGHPPGAVEQFIEFARKYYGTEKWVRHVAPSLINDPRATALLAREYRAISSPKRFAAAIGAHFEVDVRAALQHVRAPTLVMSRSGYRWVPMSHGRYLARHIAGARFIEIPGEEFGPFWEHPDLILDHIEEFLTGTRRGGEAERALVAVLFTDIVDSTKHATELGDKAWRALLDRHDEIQREQTGMFKGRIVDSAGDGTLATFERPDRAIECALAVIAALARENLQIRAGIHFGDVELRDDGRVGGVNVHVGARVLSHAATGEVLVSRTVRDILLGSHHRFDERGEHTLKGVPGQWLLYAVGGREDSGR